MFDNLSKEIAAFQGTTGLACLNGCGKCCHKPDITATPLEFLPLAYYLYKEKKAVIWHEYMKSYSGAACPLFKSLMLNGDRGFCSEYKHRGLICRLFGFSAALDKGGSPQLITCKTIKVTQEDKFEAARVYIFQNGKVPLMRNYYFQLSAIDSEMNMRFYPVHQAIQKALEIVLAYYAYRRRAG